MALRLVNESLKRTLLICNFPFCQNILTNSFFLTCFFHQKRVVVVQFDLDATVFLYTKYIF